MFIRKNTRRYKDRTYINYTLVESVHTPNGPRQKIICSLGDLGPRPARQWLELAHKIEAALSGQGELFGEEDAELRELVEKVRGRKPAPGRDRRPRAAGAAPEKARTQAEGLAEDEVIGVRSGQVTTECHREAGPEHVGIQFWKRLGLEQILAEAGLSGRQRALSCAMVMNRLIGPSSEHALPGWVNRGMAYEENLEQIQARGLHYLVAARQSERDQWLAEFEDAEGFAEVVRPPSPLNPFQKKTRIQVKLQRQGEQTY